MACALFSVILWIRYVPMYCDELCVNVIDAATMVVSKHFKIFDVAYELALMFF